MSNVFGEKKTSVQNRPCSVPLKTPIVANSDIKSEYLIYTEFRSDENFNIIPEAAINMFVLLQLMINTYTDCKYIHKLLVGFALEFATCN